MESPPIGEPERLCDGATNNVSGGIAASMTAQSEIAGLETPVKPEAATAGPLESSVKTRILLYLGVLVLLIGFGPVFGGLFDVPISFFLKNRLHLSAPQVAVFRLASAIPLYLSFVFGFITDTWHPFGLRYRGYMIVFGAITAALYLTFAYVHATYFSLLAGVVLLTSAFLFVLSAQNGLTATIGRQHVMSGQVSAVWNVFLSVPVLLTFFFGGALSVYLERLDPDAATRTLFLLGGAIMTAVTIYAVWRPKVVYENVKAEETARRPLDDIVRLARHWPAYPALLVWLLWNFAPGSVTPLQYYLQNTLHSTDAAYGNFNAIFAGSFIPTFMLFGVLCRKFPLKTLLLWGTVVAVPQMVPLLFIHSVTGALIAAVPIGLMGGVCTAAYYDLMMRSCPKGLEGTILMMSVALYWIASRFGDILGTNLYQHGGFKLCVAAITFVYALILPALLLVPKGLIATADGQVPERPFDAD
jgi:hypothetical protein